MIKIGILIDGQNSKTWNIDYKKLVEYIKRHYAEFIPLIKTQRIYLSAEVTTEVMQEDFWGVMQSIGFEIVKRTHLREQKVDVDAHLGSELRKFAYQCDVIILIAGDGDYIPVLEDLVAEGLASFLIITERSNTSSDIKQYYRTSSNSSIQVKYLDSLDIYR